MNTYNCFPFAAVCGQEKVKKALILAAINPRIGGVLISGEKGTAKSTLVRGLAQIMEDTDLINLPLNITEDRLVGSIDMGKAIQYGQKELEEGLLKKAHGQFLYVDEVNLLSPHIAGILLEVASTGVNIIEREGISHSHPARFVLVGSMNPEEGILSPQFLDRFGLYVEAKGEREKAVRAEIMHRRLAYEQDPEGFSTQWREAGQVLARRIKSSKSMLKEVQVPEEGYKLAAELAKAGRCAGHRAEIILVETARALAALAQRTELMAGDIREAATYVLPHRLREALVIEEVMTGEPEMDREEAESPAEGEKAPEKGERAPEGCEREPEQDREEPEEGRDPEPEKAGNRAIEDSSRVSDENEKIEGIEKPGETLSIQILPENKSAPQGSGKRNKVRTDSRQGRYIRYRFLHGPLQDIAFDATFRAAAVKQAYRDKGELALAVKAEDLREKVREKRTGATLLFVVDASGSMGAKRRMGAVKGAILSLLNDAYQKRDSIGMIAFRKDGAEVLLNITRSVDLAQKCLETLPTGGKTPLAAGLAKAYELLKVNRIKNPEALQYIILVSDGKANLPLFSDQALKDALIVGKKIRHEGIRSMVLDTENSYIQFGFAKELADAMGSVYLKLQNITRTEIEDNIKNVLKKN